MDTFNLKQHVNFVTHIKGHTLDLFITPEECKYKINIESTEILSDHFSVTATIDLVIPKLPPKTITYRALNKINLAQFKNDLAKSDLLTSTCSNAASLYQLYHTTLSSLLNKHAPIKTRTCSSRPKEPWMSEAILVEKRKKRQLERAWRHSKLKYMHRCLTRQVHYFNHIVSQAKSDWYNQIT